MVSTAYVSCDFCIPAVFPQIPRMASRSCYPWQYYCTRHPHMCQRRRYSHYSSYPRHYHLNCLHRSHKHHHRHYSPTLCQLGARVHCICMPQLQLHSGHPAYINLQLHSSSFSRHLGACFILVFVESRYVAIEARRAAVDDVAFIDIFQRIVDARNTSGLTTKLRMRRGNLARVGRVES